MGTLWDGRAVGLGVPGRSSPAGKKNYFGPRLKTLRKARKSRAVDVIARLGTLGWDVTAQTYSEIESGKRMLADTELMLILRVLGASLRDLE